MEEGLLGVNDKGVRNPEQLDQPPVQAQALVSFEDEALVRPALTEEYGGRVVLRVRECDFESAILFLVHRAHFERDIKSQDFLSLELTSYIFFLSYICKCDTSVRDLLMVQVRLQ